MSEEVPSPPYPNPHDNAVLRAVVANAIEALESGELDARGAILHAAVHGWLEGHLEGEECSQGCIRDPRWHDMSPN